MDDHMDDIMNGLDQDVAPEKPAAKSRGKASKAKAEPQVPEAQVNSGLTGPVSQITKTPRADWPVIILDEEANGTNYKFVQISGVGFQIQRGIEVAVPPEILGVLNDAVATRLVQVKDPATGAVYTKKQNYAGTPYRVVRFGKGRVE